MAEKNPYGYKVALRGKATDAQRELLRGMAQSLAQQDGINSEKSKYGESTSVSLLEATDVGDEQTSFSMTLELDAAQIIPTVLAAMQQTIERMGDVLEAAITITLQCKLNEDNPALDLVALGVEQVDVAA